MRSLVCAGKTASEATGCQHLDFVVHEIQKSLIPDECAQADHLSESDRRELIDRVARRHVLTSMQTVFESSEVIRQMAEESRLKIAGGLYNVSTGEIELFE